MKVMFTGDLFLGGDLLNKSTEAVIDSDTFKCADIRIVNLEQPISNNNFIACKSTLYTGSFATDQLKQLKINAVNLAHNHIQDKGKEGITETICHLDNFNIGHFGAGKDIFEAKKPYYLADNLCIIGYCEFGRSYLKQVQLATDTESGVNPLRYESVIHDLNQLPEGTKVILYFHWGVEHVWFPPASDIELARKLLDDDRVLLILGMHCHRVQGYINHKGKRAYMSLGNFLFPNFFISPPTQIAYPDLVPKKYPVTKQYHSVVKLTYKKWRVVNRISLIIEYNTETQSVKHIPVVQEDNEPKGKELSGFLKRLVLLWVFFLTETYKIPFNLYNIIENVNSILVRKFWNLQIFIFYIRQRGFKYYIKNSINFIQQVLNKM